MFICYYDYLTKKSAFKRKEKEYLIQVNKLGLDTIDAIVDVTFPSTPNEYYDTVRNIWINEFGDVTHGINYYAPVPISKENGKIYVLKDGKKSGGYDEIIKCYIANDFERIAVLARKCNFYYLVYYSLGKYKQTRVIKDFIYDRFTKFYQDSFMMKHYGETARMNTVYEVEIYDNGKIRRYKTKRLKKDDYDDYDDDDYDDYDYDDYDDDE